MDVSREKAFNRRGRGERPRRTRRKPEGSLWRRPSLRLKDGCAQGDADFGLGSECDGPLDVGALLSVALQVPAGLISCVREERVGAGLRLGGIEEEFRLAVLLGDGVVGGDRDLSERSAVGDEAVAEDGVVDGVGEQGNSQQGREGDEENSL